jgi:hypothetical protein
MVVCFVLFFCLGFVDCSRKLVTCFVKSFTNGCIDDSTAYTYTCCSTASEVFCDFAVHWLTCKLACYVLNNAEHLFCTTLLQRQNGGYVILRVINNEQQTSNRHLYM